MSLTEHEAVGMLLITRDGNDTVCTASLISPTEILSAAHCLESIDAATFYTGDIDLFDGTFTGTATDIDEVTLHPSHVIGGNSADFDIAVATLDQAINTITPLKISAGGIGLVQGQKLTQVGFGVNATEVVENDDGEEETRDTGSGTKRMTDDILFDGFSNNGSLLNIDASADNQVACGGDSGGPVIASGVVVGVQSSSVRFANNAALCENFHSTIVPSTAHFYDFIADNTTLPPRMAQKSNRATPALPLTGLPSRPFNAIQHGDQRPTLSWPAQEREYDLQVNRVQPTTALNIHRGRTYGTVSGNLVSFKVPNALPCATYRYRYAVFGDVSGYTFKVIEEATQVVFTWSSVPDAKRYELLVHKWDTVNGGNEVSNIFRFVTTDRTEVTSTTLPAGTYRFKVRAISEMSRYKWFDSCPE